MCSIKGINIEDYVEMLRKQEHHLNRALKSSNGTRYKIF